jgi:hypothetical protein
MKFRRTTLGLAILVMAASAPGLARADSGLTLKRVMLSSAGIGYYEYEADVDGPTELGLDVNLDQVDDVLTSLVVFDDKGGVGGIELPGRDSSQAAFSQVPFGPDAIQSPISYLNSLQGVEISVAGPRPMSGRILNAVTVVEPSATPGGPGVPRTRVTLMGDQGLQQFILEDETTVQVADPALRSAIDHALDSLRRDAAHNTRHLTLRVSGQGHRTIRVGYVVAAPLWKASYRLVIPGPTETKARLQGWAVLENTSGIDWKGVDLSLQYGNPVTFHQAIYQSYFVQRPEVPVEILSRLLPDVDTRSEQMADAPFPSPERMMAPAPTQMMEAGGLQRENRSSIAMAAPAEQTEAVEDADETVFRLPSPVSLAAGHTASVPILDRLVPASRVDLTLADRSHPLAAVRILNDSATSLPGGVLALYDPNGDAMFAGDARLGGVPMGETRILSYAEDLRTTISQTSTEHHSVLTIAAAQGVMRMKSLDRIVLDTVVTAPATEARHILLQIDKEDGRSLTLEGGAVSGMQETATAWRIPVDLKQGEVRHITAYMDNVQESSVSIGSFIQQDGYDEDFEGLNGVSPAVKAAMHHLMDLQRVVVIRQSEQAALIAQRTDLYKDEDRLRENLKVVPVGDALHTKLIQELSDSESKIGDLKTKTDAASSAVDKAQNDFDTAVSSLVL